MNLVGKILVLLIFVMSVAFMSFSCTVYSTHQNWRDKIYGPKGLNVALEAQKKQNSELETQITALSNKANEFEAARRQALAKLESERDQLTREREQLINSQKELDEKNAALNTVLSTSLSQLESKQKQVASLREDIIAAQQQRDENFTKFVESTDKLNQQLSELRRLEQLGTRLAEQVAKAKIVLEHKGASLDTPVDGQPPELDGIVLAATQDLVEISLGSDMGLSRGNQLDVARGAKYVGRIEVIQTQPDRAVGRVMPNYQKSKIQKDDRVYTRLQ